MFKESAFELEQLRDIVVSIARTYIAGQVTRSEIVRKLTKELFAPHAGRVVVANGRHGGTLSEFGDECVGFGGEEEAIESREKLRLRDVFANVLLTGENEG
jgi:hypothetical protein